jgi:hypothetical protein
MQPATTIRMRQAACLIFLGALLSGCSGAEEYQAEQRRKTIEAQNVMPQNYRADILAFMRTYLNNPENVRAAALSEPRKLLIEDIERYGACLRFDARNSAGRYLGLRDHLAVFVSGKFDRLIELGRAGPDAPASDRLRPLREYCAGVAYQAFPELEHLRR